MQIRTSHNICSGCVQGMSNDVALALESWWQMPALPGAADDDDDSLLGPWREPDGELSLLRAGGRERRAFRPVVSGEEEGQVMRERS